MPSKIIEQNSGVYHEIVCSVGSWNLDVAMLVELNFPTSIISPMHSNIAEHVRKIANPLR